MQFCRYGLIISLLVASAFTGCNDKSIEPQARKNLDSGLQAYRAGNYRGTIAQADAILAETSRGSLAMQAYYLRGMARYEQKNFNSAKIDIEHVIDGSDNVQLRIRALDAMGEIAYQQGDMPRSEDFCKKVIELADPGQKPTDHAHYRLGCVLQRLGKWRKADVHFQRVIFLFSRSKLANQARSRVNGRKWTIQIGSYASRQNARNQAEKFSSENMKTFVQPVLRDGKLTFMLQTGRWEKYEAAAGQLSAVRKIKADAFLQVTR